MIERNTREPRIDLAMKCCLALPNLDIGKFFARICVVGLRETAGETRKQVDDIGKLRVVSSNINNNPFSLLLRETRVVYGLSQKNLVKLTDYSHRNLISVENGKQVPILHSVLTLVSTIGCDIALFFTEIANRYRAFYDID